MSSSPKFVLPFDGKIINDDKFKAIEKEAEVRMPFKSFVLEFQADPGFPINEYSASKRIILVHEDQDTFTYTPITYLDFCKLWIILPCTRISRFISTGSAGGAKIFEHRSMFTTDSYLMFRNTEAGRYESGVVLGFLNALSCRNVHVEKSPAKSTKQGKKVKTALPFDDYHFLTVDVPGKASARGEGFGGSHRSPREHLRRGHIRRLDTGPIWVNACVVNAGIGSKVGKSYLLRKSA